MTELYENLALKLLERYSVRHFFENVAYRKGVTLSKKSPLTSENIQALRDQLKQTEAEYMFDGFLMDLALSSDTSKKEKFGLIRLMRDESEIACGLKSLEYGTFTKEEISQIVKLKNLSDKTKGYYNLS